ncbi:hypothetical protein PR202_gb24989 [Eleusine coracana subsp. coracana]|uniref:Uncharacterized protein n=1 Tax=Eleusine coracana subsp. coracana TaxID=191504 RepID=A0AAV5FNY3_ELECO|nr:hypothetical protein PR202_gb24989 [Eleusine coracana subsp. coracana]
MGGAPGDGGAAADLGSWGLSRGRGQMRLVLLLQCRCRHCCFAPSGELQRRSAGELAMTLLFALARPSPLMPMLPSGTAAAR